MLTFLDSGVLILLAGSVPKDGRYARAHEVASDPARQFVSCEMVRLECLPKAQYHKQKRELDFYDRFFSKTVADEPLGTSLTNAALALACEFGLSGPDALNIAAALKLNAEEFVTSERSTKPLFRVVARGIRVQSICPPEEHESLKPYQGLPERHPSQQNGHTTQQ